MLGVGEPGDRETRDSQRRRPDGRDTGQAGQQLSLGAGEQGVDGGDIGAQQLAALQIAAERERPRESGARHPFPRSTQ